VLDEIQKRISEPGGEGEQYRGLHAYLRLSHEYLSVFSEDKTLESIIESLGFVVFFVRIWNSWLQVADNVSVKNEGITYQTNMDLELSCANLINALCWCADQGYTKVLPNRMGTDIVETFWCVIASASLVAVVILTPTVAIDVAGGSSARITATAECTQLPMPSIKSAT
jgi:hypothetical protein